jgi:hypothetical protein
MPGELAVDRSNRKSRAGISLFPIRIHRKGDSGHRYWPMPSTSPLWRIGLGLIDAVPYLCHQQGRRALFYIVRLEVKQRACPSAPNLWPD